MLQIFKPIAKYFKIKKVRVYDGVFGLHCQVTVALFVACAIIVSAKEYFGKAIDCLSDEKNKDFVSTFCWVKGTYITESFRQAVGTQAASIGVTGEMYDARNPNVPLRIYQRYYPWIVLFLFFEAITFLSPAYLWKIWEGGRLQQMCEDLGSVFVPDEWNTKRKDLLTGYFSKDNKAFHMCYAMKYFTCELLNCVVCGLNMLLLNWFFSGFWEKFTPALGAASQYNWELWDLHSSVLFPKMAKCEFFNYGSSGTLQNMDVLCVLPLNMLNDKIFAVLAAWLIFMTVVSSLNLFYRLFVLCSAKHRQRLLRAHLNCTSPTKMRSLYSGRNIGDWFMLYQVARNINPSLFRELVDQLDKKTKVVSADA